MGSVRSGSQYGQYDYGSAEQDHGRWNPPDTYNTFPKLEPHSGPALGVTTIQKAHDIKRVHSAMGTASGKCVWTDSVQHLEDWPSHAIPLFVFSSYERPHPAYREEVKFTIKEEKYVNFGLRMRCGGGDRHNGGVIGLLTCPHRTEAEPGAEGQLVTVTDITVMPDNSVVVSAIGDLGFRVRRAWMPRGLRGLQCAVVDVEPAAPSLAPIFHNCSEDPTLQRFAHLVQLAAPALRDMLADPTQSFTAFVPTNEALAASLGGYSDEALAGRPEVEAMLGCHIVAGRICLESLYSGRGMMALDGTPLVSNFRRWPKGEPIVNDIPMEQLDIMCANGVIHSIAGVLKPAPAARRQKR